MEPEGEHWSFELKWKDRIGVLQSMAVELIGHVTLFPHNLSETN